jgi:two-component system, cell cycle response regulator
MNFNKYKNLLFQKIKDQISLWFESDHQAFIPNLEVYHFLHSIKGTSGTLQLGGVHQLSGILLDQIEETNENQWKKDDLRNFLNDLINLVYNYEHFEEKDSKIKRQYDENIPLIQIIDDDVSMLILLKDVLEQKGWMVITNSTSEKAISQYFDLHPDCVIIDVDLPNKSGFEVLEDLQKHNSRQFVPKIMISIFNDRNTRMNAFRMGADDFIPKPIDIEEMTVHIERHLKRKQIYDQSVLLDELTNLYNRRYLVEAFNRANHDLKRNEQVFSLAILDIDHFKKINDQFGHIKGDEVLSTFATFLNENTKNTDIVFRYGGEEFIILFQNVDHQQAIEISRGILEQFSKIQFESNGKIFSVTFSGGVHSIYSPETTLETALEMADQALYRAKELGRSRVEGADHPVLGHVKRKLYITIIDDDAIIRMILMRILQKLNIPHYEINIQAFEDGITFFDSNRLNENGRHFLILDGIMPKMDGIEILNKVKQEKNDNDLLVMMLTGRNGDTDVAEALRYGADDYVIKPFIVSELQERIQRLIQKIEK